MITFACVAFDKLTAFELYEIMALRQEVFVVEQNCPYLDADGRDIEAWHLTGRTLNGVLVCYARILPKGISYEDFVSIGRVITKPSARKTGSGKAIMNKSIELCALLFGEEPIKIGAQSYLLKFYERLGFQSTGEEYVEDGIPHTSMIRFRACLGFSA